MCYYKEGTTKTINFLKKTLFVNDFVLIFVSIAGGSRLLKIKMQINSSTKVK